jgi:hypothetical protein
LNEEVLAQFFSIKQDGMFRLNSVSDFQGFIILWLNLLIADFSGYIQCGHDNLVF